MAMDTIIFSGTIKSAYIRGNEDKQEYRLNIDLDKPKETYGSIIAFANTSKKYIPTWYKNQDGNIILKSRYDIPVMNTDGDKVTFEDWLAEGLISGAKVKCKIKMKEGAIYPISLKILEDGEELDYFDGM